MENWLDPKACEDALWDFCTRMRDPRNVGEREECRRNNAFARECFARDWFYLEEDRNRDPQYRPIPQDTEFRVYNDEEKDRRAKLVTLVLPPDDVPFPLSSRLMLPAEDVWKGAWFPYRALAFRLIWQDAPGTDT